MLALYSFLAAFLWGSFIGARMQRGYRVDKIVLPGAHAIIGAAVFTVPAVATLFTSPVTGQWLIIAGLALTAGFLMGLRVGITTYWID